MSTCDYLIVGGDGLIGAALAQRLRAEGGSVSTTSRQAGRGDLRLDLASPFDFGDLPSRCRVAYLLAAVTTMATCEANPESTRRINVDQPLLLATELASRGAHVITVSTSLVFDGSAPRAPLDGRRRPQNIYAEQKAALECNLLEAGFPTSVLRCTKVGETLMPLLGQWATQIKGKRNIFPFEDLVCSPVSLSYVVDALVRLGAERKYGLYQISGDRDLGYDEIARCLATALGPDALHQVHPTTSVEQGVNLTSRPRFASLDSKWTEEQLGLSPEVVDHVIGRLVSRVATEL